MDQLIAYAAAHGVAARAAGAELELLTEWWVPATGERGADWVRIPATLAALRAELGY